MEVVSWAAADSEGTSRIDQTDGRRESRVGSRADRERAAAKARSSRVASHVAKYMPRPAPGRPREVSGGRLREAVGWEERYECLLHDRDAIFSAELDESIRRLGLRVLKSPPRSPKANSICERLIGTIRRECLDWIIPLSEAHLRQTLKLWMAQHNRGARIRR